MLRPVRSAGLDPGDRVQRGVGGEPAIDGRDARRAIPPRDRSRTVRLGDGQASLDDDEADSQRAIDPARDPARRVGQDDQREKDRTSREDRQIGDHRHIGVREVADEPREAREDRQRSDPVARSAIRDDQPGGDHRPADGDVGQKQGRAAFRRTGELVRRERSEEEREQTDRTEHDAGVSCSLRCLADERPEGRAIEPVLR